jgi:hypothetical protein
MDNLESKILEILKCGTPLRAAKMAEMLGVERREVNHYLYSSLKHLVEQDSDYKWSLKANQRIDNHKPQPTQTPKTPQNSSVPLKRDTSYRFARNEIKQDTPVPPSIPPINPPAQPIKQSNPYEVVRQELAQVSPQEKIKIIEAAFNQDKFSKLDDEQVNALQSILEQARHEISIANTAYQQGKLSFWKNNYVAIALSISLALSIGSIITQLYLNTNRQVTPTLLKNK